MGTVKGTVVVSLPNGIDDDTASVETANGTVVVIYRTVLVMIDINGTGKWYCCRNMVTLFR